MNDDAMLQYLIEMGAIQQQDAGLQRRQAMIESLRNRPQADTGLQQAGRVTVAASPFAHLANAFNQGQAGYMQRQVGTEQDALGQSRLKMLERLRAGMMGGGARNDAGSVPY